MKPRAGGPECAAVPRHQGRRDGGVLRREEVRVVAVCGGRWPVVASTRTSEKVLLSGRDVLLTSIGALTDVDLHGKLID